MGRDGTGGYIDAVTGRRLGANAAACELTWCKTDFGDDGAGERFRTGGIVAVVEEADAAAARALQTNSLQDISAAIIAWEPIAQGRNPPVSSRESARAWSAIAALQLRRWQVGGNLEDCDDAIASLETSGALASQFDDHSFSANLATLYMERFDHIGDTADMDRVFALLEPTISAFETSGTPSSHALVYARALGYRYARAGNLDDLARRIALLEECAAAEPDPREEAYRLGALGNALSDRFAVTTTRRDLDRSIRYLEQALDRLPRSDKRLRANLLTCLGAGLRRRNETGDESSDLDRAIRLQQDAVALAPHVWGYQNNLACAYHQRARFQNSRRDLDRAIAGFIRVLDHTADDSPDLPGYMTSYADALDARGHADRSEGDIRAAVDLYQRACGLGLENNVDLAFDAAFTWATSATARESWHEATVAYAYGLAARDRLLQEQATRRGKEERLRRAQDLAPRAAYAHAKAGRLEAAVLMTEWGRGLLGADERERFRADAGLDLPSMDCLAVLSHDCPLVYVISTEPGGVALVVRAGEVTATWLDDLGLEEVFARLSVYLEAMLDHGNCRSNADDDVAWRAALDRTGKWLWSSLMSEVLSAVAAAGRIRMVPVGPLAVFPLHAAWKFDRTTPTGRRYACDEVVITYLPNARSGIEAERVSSSAPVEKLLVVADPDLGYAEREAELAAAVFAPNARILTGSHRTRDAVMKAIAESDVVHFACHGVADLVEPMRTGLALHGDERLTVADLLGQRLDSRLVVLSACETALNGLELPDESVGLPSAILQAGAGGVVASCWKVADAEALHLMTEFYRRWPMFTLSPGEALRDAQVWLRDTTNAEKLVVYDAMLSDGRLHAAAHNTIDALRREVATADPNDRGFGDLAGWAAFIHIGA